MMTEEEKRAKATERMRKWRAANPGRERAIQQRQYEKTGAARMRQWRASNREKDRENQRQRRAANPEKARAYSRDHMRRQRALRPEIESAWLAANPEKVKAAAAKYRSANADKRHKLWRQWAAANPQKVISNVWLRARRVREATPPWVDRREMRAIREACPAGFHVDHIVPLRGITYEGYPVRGLHVPWNLQYLSAFENLSKKNKVKPLLLPNSCPPIES